MASQSSPARASQRNRPERANPAANCSPLRPWDVISLGPRWTSALAAEARRRWLRNLHVRVKGLRAREQNVLGLRNLGVRDAAVDGADRRTLFLVEEADALRAFLGDDVVD